MKYLVLILGLAVLIIMIAIQSYFANVDMQQIQRQFKELQNLSLSNQKVGLHNQQVMLSINNETLQLVRSLVNQSH